jgi:8-oxo-dGTP pyrophosphatase MutT (NUDIX family)
MFHRQKQPSPTDMRNSGLRGLPLPSTSRKQSGSSLLDFIPPAIQRYLIFGLLLLVPLCILWFYTTTSSVQVIDRFEATARWRTDQTVSAELLYSTPFARVEIHQVKGEQDGKVYKDWVWIDVNDQVNILAHVFDEAGQDKFLIMKHTKYGISGQSLAVVGGLIEKGETSLEAAKRELLEELGFEASEWKAFGTFRTDVNRGGGMISPFLAYNCTRSREFKESDDLEQHELLYVTRAELQEALSQGMFAEVKWTATVALSLVYLNQ